jgi:hypothetical protein
MLAEQVLRVFLPCFVTNDFSLVIISIYKTNHVWSARFELLTRCFPETSWYLPLFFGITITMLIKYFTWIKFQPVWSLTSHFC